MLALLAAMAGPSAAAVPSTLQGSVVDALDGRPLPGARVCAEGRDVCDTTDEVGQYALDLPAGNWTLSIEAEGHVPSRLANQQLGGIERPGRAHLFPEAVPHDFMPTEFSLAGRGTGLGPEPRGAVRLPESPWLASVPASLPSTIKVARYFTSGCSGSYERIDTIEFEEYVKGVVNAEVGVFRGVEGGPAAAAECWKAFAVAARSYALHFILTSPYANYDINDTACNQVYKDDRQAEVSAAVDATRGQVLVKGSDHDVIDRYFYAASCAEHGTEPAYRGGIIPDVTPSHACVGTWCGHDNCAAHADNPNVPGDDRCLVWGTCQWGSIERSMDGDSYREILGHYQPDCAIRDFNAPLTGTITGVVYQDPDLALRIEGAVVTLDNGPSVTYDGVTAWSFEVSPGEHTVRATAEGYLPGSQTRTVAAGETVWASLGLAAVPELAREAEAREGEGSEQGADAEAAGDADADMDSDADSDVDAGSDGDTDSDYDTDSDPDALLTCAARGGYCADWASQGCREGFDPTDPVECLTDVCCAPEGDASPSDGCGCGGASQGAVPEAMMLLLVLARLRSRGTPA